MPVVIVTGASSGIGRATALRLGRAGYTVVLAARRADELAAAAAEINAATAASTAASTAAGAGTPAGSGAGTAVVVPTDVRDPAAIEALVARALEVDGRIDGLVNNAGVGGKASVLAEDDVITQTIDVNLVAPIRLMRAVVPIMRQQRSGSIVNIGSVAGEIGVGGVYSATKFALRGMTDSVRRELAGTGIGVTLIEPGFIDTGMNNRKNLPGPEIVAAAVESALRRPRRRIVVPVKYRAAITAANALPSLADRLLAGRIAPRRDT
jgi:NAD(P)-dependent dehydrogenase (short-subunit alcohol dehydrogenase family)